MNISAKLKLSMRNVSVNIILKLSYTILRYCIFQNDKISTLKSLYSIIVQVQTLNVIKRVKAEFSESNASSRHRIYILFKAFKTTRMYDKCKRVRLREVSL